MAPSQGSAEAAAAHPAGTVRAFLSANRTPVSHVVAGSTAGMTATLLLHPLDLVKTRLQVEDINAGYARYRGVWHAFTTIIRKEGALALYRGVTPNVLGNGTAWGSYFFGYSYLKRKLREQDPENRPLSHAQHLIAANTAGIFTLLITNPFWLVKTRMCLREEQGRPAYRSVPHALGSILREEGVRGLYKGLTPGLLGTTHGGLQFMAYEATKRRLHQMAGRTEGELSVPEYLFSAVTSKIFAGSATYPYQVVRSRLQRARTAEETVKARTIMAKVWGEFGWRGFYHGLGPYLIRVMPATCVTFVVYEKLSSFLQAKL